ncbi:tyrosine-type recombinase/integrase, partial [Xanthomonas euvesicatoria]|uniref:tyrosine-type recombinase/integrase n=1 Tax=Xanthomonas euvesicatoria TaxID=456327 RepID=UPI0024612D21|nr:hypothetical protein [Xanthomonas euvesicatoria]
LGLLEHGDDLAVGKAGLVHGTSSGKGTRKFHFWRLLMGGGITLTGRGEYVFPSIRNPRGAMSENTINAALRTMGFDSATISGHGFRAMARTVLDEVLGFRPDFIEHQLAHAVRDPNGRAYNRTAHLTERQKMMQAWADYLDALKADTASKVVPSKQGTAQDRP